MCAALAWPLAGRGAETSHGGAAAEEKEGEAAKEGAQAKDTEKTEADKKKEEAKKDSDAVDKFKELGDKATEKDLVSIEEKIKELSIKQNAEANPDPERTKLINDLYSTLSQYRLMEDIKSTNASNLAAETAAMKTLPEVVEATPPPLEIQEQAIQILKVKTAPVAPAPAQSPIGPINLASTPYSPMVTPQKVSLAPITRAAPSAPVQAPTPTAPAAAPESLPIRVSSSAPAPVRPTMPELPALPASSPRQTYESRPSAPIKTTPPVAQSITAPPVQEFTPPAPSFENTPPLSIIRASSSEVASETVPPPAQKMATLTIPTLDIPAKERPLAEPEADPFGLAQKEANTVAWNPPDVSPEGRALFKSEVFAAATETAPMELGETTEPTGEKQKPAKKKPVTTVTKEDDLAVFLRASLRR